MIHVSFARLEEFRREHPEIYEELAAFAASLLSSPADAAEDQASMLGKAAESGFVLQDERSWDFADENLREQFLVEQSLDLALASWDSDEGLARALSQARVRATRRPGEVDLAATILVALAERGKDVVERVGGMAATAVASESRSGAFWSVYHPFCKALPDLVTDPGRLVDALGPVQEAVQRDVTNGLIHAAVREVAGTSRELAETLTETFLSHPDSRVTAFAADAILGLANFDMAVAHERAITLTEQQDPVLLRTGIHVLGTLPYSADEDDPHCAATLQRLADLRARPLPDAEHMLPDAYGYLLPRSEAKEGIVELARRNDPSVQYMTALVLMRNSDAAAEPWFGTALHRLACTGPNQEQTLQFLDHALAKHAERDPADAISVLGEWAGAGGLKGVPDDAKLPETFSSTFRYLRTSARDQLEAAITRWWASDNRTLHRGAWQVVGGHDFESDADGRPPLALSATALSELDEQTVRLVLCRVIAYVVGGKPLTVLILSALGREPCSSDLAAFITDALDRIVLYNYPGGASEYLNARLATPGLPSAEADVIHTAMERSETYFAARQAIPTCTELRPPSSRLAVLQRARGKQTTAVMEAAQNRSVLLQLVRRVPLKYGRGFAFQHAGAAAAPNPLHAFEYELEIPRGELIDPIGQAARRLQWQSLGLAENLDREGGEDS
jgi:hypothetical protein